MRRLIALALALTACGESEATKLGEDTTGASVPASAADTVAAIRLVLDGAWCKANGCTLEKRWPLRTGGENWSIVSSADDHAAVEAQTTDGHLAGAGIVLAAGGGRKPGQATLASLQTYARAITGECPGADEYIAKHYTRSVSGVMEAPLHPCGAWQLRAGRVGIDFTVSIDKGS
jgi:hypothetical protein